MKALCIWQKRLSDILSPTRGMFVKAKNSRICSSLENRRKDRYHIRSSESLVFLLILGAFGELLRNKLATTEQKHLQNSWNHLFLVLLSTMTTIAPVPAGCTSSGPLSCSRPFGRWWHAVAGAAAPPQRQLLWSLTLHILNADLFIRRAFLSMRVDIWGHFASRVLFGWPNCFHLSLLVTFLVWMYSPSFGGCVCVCGPGWCGGGGLLFIPLFSRCTNEGFI